MKTLPQGIAIGGGRTVPLDMQEPGPPAWVLAEIRRTLAAEHAFLPLGPDLSVAFRNGWGSPPVPGSENEPPSGNIAVEMQGDSGWSEVFDLKAWHGKGGGARECRYVLRLNSWDDWDLIGEPAEPRPGMMAVLSGLASSGGRRHESLPAESRVAAVAASLLAAEAAGLPSILTEACRLPRERCRSLLAHEMGHYRALQALGFEAAEAFRAYDHPLSSWLPGSSLLPPSLYGGFNAQEWLAESYAAYRLGLPLAEGNRRLVEGILSAVRAATA